MMSRIEQQPVKEPETPTTSYVGIRWKPSWECRPYGPSSKNGSSYGSNSSDSIDIYVIDTNHKTIPLHIDSSRTVESVMETIRDRLSIPVDQQRLVCAGKSLEKKSTLQDCGVMQDSTLFLHLFIQGGSYNYADNYNGYSYDAYGNSSERYGKNSGGYSDSSSGYGNYGQTSGTNYSSSSSGYSQYGQNSSGYDNYGQTSGTNYSSSGYSQYSQNSGGYDNYGKTSGTNYSSSGYSQYSQNSGGYDNYGKTSGGYGDSSSASRCSYYDDLRSSAGYVSDPPDSRFDYSKLQEDYNANGSSGSRRHNTRSSNSSNYGAKSSHAKSGRGYGGRK